MTKTFTIINAERYDAQEKAESHLVNIRAKGGDNMEVTDGYHTFEELYEHRLRLWINLCYTYFCLSKLAKAGTSALKVWRSKLHSDGSSYDGWFILGIGEEAGSQITYHISNDFWDECDFAHTLEKAPEFDGHTSNDVLERLKIKK